MNHTLLRDACADADTGDFAYLELLARVKIALDSAIDVSVPADDLRPYPDQPRKFFREDGIVRLAESIDVGGQTTPGIIREKPVETRYELIDGERRWRSVKRIPEDRRPLFKARLIEADDDVVQFLISGIANFNREGHTAIEVADTIDRLLSSDLPMKEIASLLGISEHWAYQMHGLRKLEPRVRAMLDPDLPKSELLPIVAAVHISKIDSKFQFELAQRVLRKDVSVTRLRGEVVRVAHREGVPIRVREISPRKRWESFGNKVEVLARVAGDIEHVIEPESIDRIIKMHPRETSRTLASLRRARKSIDLIEARVRQAQQ